MKKIMSVAVILMTALSLFTGCTQVAYKKASETNTIRAYAEYVTKYPSSEFTPQAEKKLEELYWQKVSETNTIRAYEEYVTKYPSNEFTPQAEKKLEELYWYQRKNQNTISAYEQYLQKYPSGKYSGEAKDWIENYEWNQSDHSEEKKIVAFIEKYPQGKLRAVAEQALSRIKASLELRDMLENLKESDISSLRVLLQQGANVSVENEKFGTPLIAASLRNLPSIAELLLDHHAPVNNKMHKATALWLAARGGNVEVMKILIKHGADLEVEAEVNWGERITPLEVAIINDHFEAAKTLLEAGADANAKSYLGIKRDSQYTRLLLEHGADVNQKTAKGSTALHQAARYNDVETARLLLKHGADINAINSDNETPFDIAAQQICIDVLELLLSNKTLQLTNSPRTISTKEGIYFDNYLKYIESVNYSKWDVVNPHKWIGVMYRITDGTETKTDEKNNSTEVPLYMVASRDGSSITSLSPVVRGAIYEYNSDTHALKKMKFTRLLLPTDNNLLHGRLEAHNANQTATLFRIKPDLSLQQVVK